MTQMTQGEQALKRLQKARKRLVLDHVFFGVPAMKMAITETTKTETMATDGRAVYFNAAWVMSQSDAELMGVYAHEILHCLMQHHTRRSNRDHNEWNIACDHAINLPLIDSGFALPEGVLLDPAFRGMSAEQVFAARRSQRQQEQQQDQPGEESDSEEEQEGESQGNDSGDDSEGDDSEAGEQSEQEGSEGEPGEGEGETQGEGDEGSSEAGEGAEGGSGAEAEGEAEGGVGEPGEGEGEGEGTGSSLGNDSQDDGEPKAKPVPGEVWDAPDPATDEAEWKVTAQQAAMAAAKFGTLPGFAAQMVKTVNKPRTDWRSILRRFVQQVAAADYSMKQPNRRYLASGVYLPALREPAMGTIVVALDTSGSTWQFQSGFLAEVQSIADEVLPERVIVIECDMRINRVTEFERGDVIATPDNMLRGQGGTDFRPPFAYVEREGIEPACMVYLTDAEGSFPNFAPDYPVMFALTPPSYWNQQQGGERVPWGESVELEGDDS